MFKTRFLVTLLSLCACEPLIAQSDFGSKGSSAEAAAPATPEPPELVSARARFEQEMKVASAPIKARYAQALNSLKKTFGGKGDLAGALLVQHEIERLGIVQNSLFMTPNEATVVIWNEHNAEHNNAGTKTLNLVLLNDGKEIWRQNDVKLPWLPDEDAKVEIRVPYVPADKLRVEVTEWIQHGGGLSEVEYLWEGRNLAFKRPSTVSANWGNSSKNGAALTDGITTSKSGGSGYWSLPDHVPGWVEVSLRLNN